jgi:hypothetical protein
MKTLQLTLLYRPQTIYSYSREICDRQNGVQGVGRHGINPEPLMSALGQKQTFNEV